jgi:hypothetical protein
MAGTFVVAEGQRWSAASWLFYWILRTIASHVDDPDLAAKFREIDDNNLGWFSLQDCSTAQRQRIVAILCSSLVPAAEREFRAELVSRDRLLVHLRALISLCCD